MKPTNLAPNDLAGRSRSSKAKLPWLPILVLALSAASVPTIANPAITGQTPVVQSESYLIQAEDVLVVTVQDVSEASGEFLVRKDGRITIPMIGEIAVTGKTTAQVTSAVTELLKKEIKNPRVTINLKSSASQRVYVMGAVKSSGVLDWKPKWRLTEVISAAGGLSSTPERTRVLLFRAGSEHKDVQLRKLLVDGDDTLNYEIQPGDVVNFQTDVTLRVQVVGQVSKSGSTEVLEGQGVVEVLAACGGAGPDARLSAAKIVRKGKEIPIDLYAAVKRGDTTKNLTVQDGDTLYVPSLLSKISVVGWVSHPGPVTVPDGEEMTLTKAVSLAGGTIREAKSDSVAVVRIGPDKKPIVMKYNLQSMLRGKAVTDPRLEDGDLVVVPQSGKTRFQDITGSLGALGLLRGFF